jgi:UTP--glucose-1-phosphate uridylyltransferase
VEKPSGDAPSDLVIIGRYALLPDVFDDLANLAPSASGEIQLSDALSVQASRHPLNGVMSNVSRRDIGNPVGWLQAVVEAGLEHAEYGPAFTAWLAQR